MNIQPAYVTFEQAKLLFEKNFNEYCNSYYEKDKSLHQYVGNYNSEDQEIYMPHYSRPEQWMVIEWLRVKHGIWIYILPYSILFRPYAEELVDEDRFGKWEGHKYNTPQEAYSAAFDYILNNLI